MLDDPDPTSPLNGEAATMFVNARAGRSWEAYKRTVRKSAQIRYSLSPQLANFDPDQKVLLTGPDAWK
jgi:hypothetical protein